MMLEQLTKLLGPANVSNGGDARTDAFTPVAIAKPATLEQAVAVVRIAREHRVAVWPRGGGTKTHWIAPPTRDAIILSTERLNRVVEYAPRDMTITVEAGVTPAELAKLLANDGQRLAIDPANGERATIGGVLATNDSGPIRLANGTARDLVIGMSMIDPQGTAIKSGGKVVKNVAGYDLHKLYIGSFGTLGLIGTVTVKLRPQPPARRLVVLTPGSADDAESLIGYVMAGATRPAMIELLNAPAARAVGLHVESARLDASPETVWLVIGFEAGAEAVDWQCRFITRLLHPGDGEVSILDDAESTRLYEATREWPGRPAPLAFKLATRSSMVDALFAGAKRTVGDALALLAHAGSGMIFGRSDDVAIGPQVVDLLAPEIERGGSIHWRSTGPVPDGARFLPAPGGIEIMRTLKSRFDPDDLFAPGTFLGKRGHSAFSDVVMPGS